jgi:hypothetical protein
MRIESQLHTEIVGRVEDQPYHVFFNANKQADVSDAVGEQLLQLGAATLVETVDKPVGNVSFADMTVQELRSYAKGRGLSLGSARSKEDILTVILNVDLVIKGGDNE